ncbi:HlyD family type I secretion periplasmic adaptor subunit [Enterobacillus tribolii]|uniref:Membrane fusion protein (MFP) family protein n=1 Tax=Enterobacillus tribolii TaxID=1487935 RepID=A0A370QEJ2_9GAMM|nr:HlyD family type I secretion periplasmic adaptor subunit [Enterobacillus tribolii]MBW7984151.1 HlyD family type I secretion periplasmic adaptor subunit [Enterobacillus tribolii]RDK86788.1 adhesin transport system membrane fusion protein [Enterobacillus tribolii]
MLKLPGKRPAQVTSEESAYLRDMHAALLAQSTPGATFVLYGVLAILLIAGTWAYLAKVEEITRGQGKVIPYAHEQVIQSLDTGVLQTLLVRAGEHVSRGQPLLKMDDTRSRASYGESNSRALALKATIARLRAEIFATPLTFPADVLALPSLVADETRAYQADIKMQQMAVAGLKKNLALAQRELGLAAPLVKKGLMSEVELLRNQRQVSELQLQLDERLNQFHADANAQLLRAESELAQVQETLVLLQDAITKSTLYAPVNGIVKNIRTTTLGAVIQSGANIMEIVPVEDGLLIETKVKPSDVAFIHPGLPATIKISAYDYSIYGGLQGEVTLVSPSTLEEEKNQAKPDDQFYYRVIIKTTADSLSAGGKVYPVIPGMVATVDIKTGEKRISDFLLKPILKSREAFRER